MTLHLLKWRNIFIHAITIWQQDETFLFIFLFSLVQFQIEISP